MAENGANDTRDGIAWLGDLWASHTTDDSLLGLEAGLVFAEGIAPQDLAVVFGALPWEMPEPVGEEARAVYDRTHPHPGFGEPWMTAYGKEGRWSFLAGKFDSLLHFREGFAFPEGTGRVVLLYNIEAKGMYYMVYFENGQRVWGGEISGCFADETQEHYFDLQPEMSFLNRAMHDAGCRPRISYVDGCPILEDEGWIPDWKKRFLKGLEIAFGISVPEETYDAGGYALASVYWT